MVLVEDAARRFNANLREPPFQEVVMAANADRNFEWAEEAVGFIVQSQWPELAKRWRGVIPKDVGVSSDDWLNLSRRMLNRYRTNSGTLVSMGDAKRKAYHTQRFIMFVVGLSDLQAQS